MYVLKFSVNIFKKPIFHKSIIAKNKFQNLENATTNVCFNVFKKQNSIMVFC